MWLMPLPNQGYRCWMLTVTLQCTGCKSTTVTTKNSSRSPAYSFSLYDAAPVFPSPHTVAAAGLERGQS